MDGKLSCRNFLKLSGATSVGVASLAITEPGPFNYNDADLRAWLDRMAAQPLTRIYVYFMHEDEALGTRFAQRLMELWRGKRSG